MPRQKLLGLGLALLSFVVGLGLAEFAIRLLPIGAIPFRDTTVSALHRRWSPRADLRDRARPAPKPEGVFRIVVLGDSFTWGDGVHSFDAYPDRLALRLDRTAAAPRFEVVNWSRPGWNTSDELKSAARVLASLEPDLLLIGFVLNDAEPGDRDLRRQLHEPLHRRSPRTLLSQALHRKSLLYKTLWERLENTRQRSAFKDFYRRLYDGSSWEECRDALKGLKQLAAEQGAPMVLVVFPIFDSQLDDSYAYRDLHHQVMTAAADLEITGLDLLPAYRGVDARRLASFPFSDPHPSELAHRIAADSILLFLRENDLIPQ